MNVLTPPTDNLYKFMAITGLLLLAAAVYFTVSVLYDMEMRVQRAEAEADVLEAELRHLERIITEGGEEARERAIQSGKTLELEVKSALIKGKTREVRYLLTKFRILKFAALGALLVGILISALGFRLWYSRVQKYQDLVLRQQTAPQKVDHENDSKPKQREAT